MRKRGFKTKLDLQKEIVELKKINKILTQEIDSLKKKLNKTEQIQNNDKEEKKDAKRNCPKCNFSIFSFVKIGKSIFLLCKNCQNREKI